MSKDTTKEKASPSGSEAANNPPPAAPPRQDGSGTTAARLRHALADARLNPSAAPRAIARAHGVDTSALEKALAEDAARRKTAVAARSKKRADTLAQRKTARRAS